MPISIHETIEGATLMNKNGTRLIKYLILIIPHASECSAWPQAYCFHYARKKQPANESDD